MAQPKRQYENDVDAALKTVEETCGDDVSNLLRQIIKSQESLLRSQASLIDHLRRTNVALQERSGNVSFNTICPP